MNKKYGCGTEMSQGGVRCVKREGHDLGRERING